jgi:hypothetical protein
MDRVIYRAMNREKTQKMHNKQSHKKEEKGKTRVRDKQHLHARR